MNEEAAKRGCAASNRYTEETVALLACVALTMDYK